MSWSDKYKRSINCDSPNGFSQRAHCAARKKRASGEETKSKSPFNESHEAVEELKNKLLDLDNISYNSIDHLMRKIMKAHDLTAKQLHNAFVDKYHKTPDTWIKQQMNEDLRAWFGKGKEGGVGGGGWDRYDSKGNRIGKCARETPNEPKPKCLSKQKASQLRSQGGANAIANAVKRKRKKDPVSDRPGKGGRPIMVSNKIREAKEEHRYCKLCGKMETRNECAWGGNFWDRYTIKNYDPNKPHPGNFPESFEIDHSYIQEKNVPTNPSLWSRMKARAKSKFDVYPSAYANGWASKEYKKAGGGWKSVSESTTTIEDAHGNTFVEIVDVIVPGQLGQTVTQESKNNLRKTLVTGTRGSIGDDPKNSPGNTNSATPTTQYEACWKGYKRKKGTTEFEKGSCVKAESNKTFGEFMAEASPAWQRKEGKNPEGGLNKKGIASYRKEHPGSKLSLAVTTKPSKLKKGSKSAKRRKSFCSRMKGMKAKLTSAKTAHDPDSRINKSLRKWNC